MLCQVRDFEDLSGGVLEEGVRLTASRSGPAVLRALTLLRCLLRLLFQVKHLSELQRCGLF